MQNQILWTAAFLNERFTEIVSPLGWSFVGSLFEQLALRDPLRYLGFPHAETIPATRLWYGHPYVNVEIFAIFYKPFPGGFVPADAVRYFPNGDLTYRKRAPYPGSIVDPRMLGSLILHLARDPLVTSPLNFIAWRRFTGQHEAQIRTLQAKLDSATNAQHVLQVIKATYALDAALLHIHRWSLTYADLFYRQLAHWAGDDAQALMSNVPNKTREVNAELAALAHRAPPLDAALLERIRAGAPLRPSEQQTADALNAFLDHHGHRAFSLDIVHPTFRDDPTQLLGLMPSRAADAETATFAPGEHMRRRDYALLKPLIAIARRYAQLREDQRYYWQKSLAVTRAGYMILGRDLAARALVANAEDIFYATRHEIAAYYGIESEPAALSARIASRKQEWAAYVEKEKAEPNNAYPLFLRGDIPLVEPNYEPQQTEWHGRGVSAGVARGTARIVQEPRELGRVNAGEILVAPSTDPAWTPVFARLKGLVMERGGVLSHGAIVAREYHLPAVTAITNLTHLLRDGEQIEIDGTSGIVRRL